MAKIRIVGDSSGYVELAAPNAAGNNTLELPSGSKLVGADANNNVNLSGIITATGGFSGNLTGNVTGNITGNVNSTGITTVTTLNIGTGTSISSPASNTLTLGTNNAERVRIDSSGRVGIGTINPVGQLQVSSGPVIIGAATSTGTASQSLQVTGGAYISGSIGIGITNPSTKLEIVGSYSSGSITTSFKISGSGWSLGGGPSLEFGHDPASYPTWVTGRIASTYSGDNWGGGLKFFYNNGTTAATLTEGMELTRGGNVQIANGNLVFSTAGKGIDFSATANSSGTMTSELLNDYETGTWTPIAGSNAGSITSYLSGGNYTKIGDTVRVNGYINITNQGTANGQYLNCSGLPFTSSGGIIHIGVCREQSVNGYLITAQVSDNITTAFFSRWDNSGVIINGNFHFTIVYKTSS